MKTSHIKSSVPHVWSTEILS